MPIIHFAAYIYICISMCCHLTSMTGIAMLMGVFILLVVPPKSHRLKGRGQSLTYIRYLNRLYTYKVCIYIYILILTPSVGQSLMVFILHNSTPDTRQPWRFFCLKAQQILLKSFIGICEWSVSIILWIVDHWALYM